MAVTSSSGSKAVKWILLGMALLVGAFLCVFIMLVVSLRGMTPPATTTISEAAPTPTTRKTDKDAVDALQFSLDNGVITRFDPQDASVYVAPQYWNSMSYDLRKDFAAGCLRAMKVKGSQWSFVVIKHAMTGQELAKYSSLGYRSYE